MIPVPLFGTETEAYSAVASAQRRLNCYYDPRPDPDSAAIILKGTPGSVLKWTLPAAPVRGSWVVNGVMYVVARQHLYSVSGTGTITGLGTLLTTSGYVDIKDNGFQLCIVDGTAGYCFTFAGSVFAQIVDANFPNGATTVTFLNGRFTVEKAGTRQAYTGQAYAAQTWTPVIFYTKENESSNILAVDTLNGTLILFGASSMEFWQDVGGTNPYQRINGTTQAWGLAAAASRQRFKNSLIFLGSNPQGYTQVLQLDGYVPVPVSTPDIEEIIEDFEIVSDAVALTYMIDGHVMYQITFPTGGRTLVYDGLTKLWSEAQTGVAVQARHYAQLGVTFNGVNYFFDETSGNIYQFEDEVYTDNGVLIKRQVRTRHVRAGGNAFSVSELYLNMETGIGLQSGQGADPMLMIQVSKDQGRTFGNERLVRIGKVGEYLTRIITRRWGQARDFVWQFTMTDPIKFLIVSGSFVMSGNEGRNADGS